MHKTLSRVSLRGLKSTFHLYVCSLDRRPPFIIYYSFNSFTLLYPLLMQIYTHTQHALNNILHALISHDLNQTNCAATYLLLILE